MAERYEDAVSGEKSLFLGWHWQKTIEFLTLLNVPGALPLTRVLILCDSTD